MKPKFNSEKITKVNRLLAILDKGEKTEKEGRKQGRKEGGEKGKKGREEERSYQYQK